MTSLWKRYERSRHYTRCCKRPPARFGAAFGENALLQLEALETDEEGAILRVVVNLPSATDAPADLMRGFKRDWWFQHCSRSGASLVFDYETFIAPRR